MNVFSASENCHYSRCSVMYIVKKTFFSINTYVMGTCYNRLWGSDYNKYSQKCFMGKYEIELISLIHVFIMKTVN